MIPHPLLEGTLKVLTYIARRIKYLVVGLVTALVVGCGGVLLFDIIFDYFRHHLIIIVVIGCAWLLMGFGKTICEDWDKA